MLFIIAYTFQEATTSKEHQKALILDLLGTDMLKKPRAFENAEKLLTSTQATSGPQSVQPKSPKIKDMREVNDGTRTRSSPNVKVGTIFF